MVFLKTKLLDSIVKVAGNKITTVHLFPLLEVFKIEQYSRNMGIMNHEEFVTIKNTRVLIVGIGGLGGHVAVSLVRLGVENLTFVDFDIFEISNLNRQLFSSTLTLDKSKVAVAKEKLLEINPDVNITTITSKYDKDIDPSLYDEIDIVFDAVDNIETKLIMEDHCTKYNKPLIHGAIGGWYGQLGIIMPNAYILKAIYQDKTKGLEDTLKSPTFTPGIVANLMVSEFIKFITNKNALVNKILQIDILNHEYRIIFQK